MSAKTTTATSTSTFIPARDILSGKNCPCLGTGRLTRVIKTKDCRCKSFVHPDEDGPRIGEKFVGAMAYRLSDGKVASKNVWRTCDCARQGHPGRFEIREEHFCSCPVGQRLLERDMEARAHRGVSQVGDALEQAQARAAARENVFPNHREDVVSQQRVLAGAKPAEVTEINTVAAPLAPMATVLETVAAVVEKKAKKKGKKDLASVEKGLERARIALAKAEKAAAKKPGQDLEAVVAEKAAKVRELEKELQLA